MFSRGFLNLNNVILLIVLFLSPCRMFYIDPTPSLRSFCSLSSYIFFQWPQTCFSFVFLKVNLMKIWYVWTVVERLKMWKLITGIKLLCSCKKKPVIKFRLEQDIASFSIDKHERQTRKRDTAESLFNIYYRKQQGNIMGLGGEQSLVVS